MDNVDPVTDRLHRPSRANLAAKSSPGWTVSLTGMVPGEVQVLISGS